jgi:hypothetical protein
LKSISKQQEIEQTKLKIEKEKKAATVNFVTSTIVAAVSFGMGAAGTGAAAGSAADSSDTSDDSKKTKSESEVELFKSRIRKLLA